MGVASGSCTDPFNLGNGDVVPVINASERLTITSFGDTSQSIHFDTPSCNTLTSSPEVVFTFEVAGGMRYGYVGRRMLFTDKRTSQMHANLWNLYFDKDMIFVLPGTTLSCSS
jgi:hypothetical protein